jgi:uncharacterized protein (TIGR02147 family)
MVMQDVSLNKSHADYRDILNNLLVERKEKNSNYSLRALARDLELNQGVLSQIIKGARQLAPEKAIEMVEKLNLNEKDKATFLETVYENYASLNSLSKNKNTSPRKTLELKKDLEQQMIEKWEYYAILNVLKIDRFKNTLEYITSRLNLEQEQVKKYLDHLVELGHVFEKSDIYFRSIGSITTTFDIPSDSIKKSHLDVLDLAKKKIYEVPVDYREYFAQTLPISPVKFRMAKRLIREFILKLDEVLDDENASEVYQLNLQFFPLTQFKEDEE